MGLTETGYEILKALIPFILSVGTFFFALKAQAAKQEEQIKTLFNQYAAHNLNDDKRFDESKKQLDELGKERRADSEKLFTKIDSVNEKVNAVNVKLAENLNLLKK